MSAHLCWVVDDGTDYAASAAALLAEGAAAGQKTVAFGPSGSAAVALPAVVALDPREAFLGGGHLSPSTMFAMFREQTEIARSEGHRSLRVVADMEWLLPTGASTDEIVGFELLLDRVVAELDATVVCAYRASSFPSELVEGALSVHPEQLGGPDPQFRIVADPCCGWRLSGEVDLAVAGTFAAAVHALEDPAGQTIDVGDLEFIDVAGMRVLARAGDFPVRLRNPSPALRRAWQLTGFAELAPHVVLDDVAAAGASPPDPPVT